MVATSIRFLTIYLASVLVVMVMAWLLYGTEDNFLQPPVLPPDFEELGLIDTVEAIASYVWGYVTFFTGLFFRSFEIPYVNFVMVVFTIIAMFIFLTEILIPFIQSLPFT